MIVATIRIIEPNSNCDHLYRDPNNVRTLEAFEQSVEWASQGNFKDEDIEEAKLSIFSSVCLFCFVWYCFSRGMVTKYTSFVKLSSLYYWTQYTMFREFIIFLWLLFYTRLTVQCHRAIEVWHSSRTDWLMSYVKRTAIDYSVLVEMNLSMLLKGEKINTIEPCCHE